MKPLPTFHENDSEEAGEEERTVKNSFRITFTAEKGWLFLNSGIVLEKATSNSSLW